MIPILFSFFVNTKVSSSASLSAEVKRLRQINAGLAKNLEEYECACDKYLERIESLFQENRRLAKELSGLIQLQANQYSELSLLEDQMSIFKQIRFELEEREHNLEILLLQERKANEALEDYLYYAAHDSERNFSAVALGFHYLQEKLQGKDNLPETSRLLQFQHAAIDEFKVFISNLFYVAKREAGRIDHVVYSEVKIKNLFQQLISIIDIDAVMFGQSVVSLVYTPGIPESVVTDELMMRQIIMNLLINAKERTNGIVMVMLMCDNANLIMHVINQGAPIPEEIKAKIFDKNFTTNRTTGKGVGLTITKMLVQALGGTIVVSNQANFGPIFSVTLPIICKADC